VRVAQGSHRLRLALEAGAAFRICADVMGQDLDGDGAVEAGITGLLDLAHAARTDGRLDLVGSQARAGCEAHGTSVATTWQA